MLVSSEKILHTTIVTKNQNQTATRIKLSTATTTLNNHPHQASTIFSLQHSTYLLFSENVFIVEGKTEKMLLPELYKLLRGRSIGHDKTCMIEAGGTDSIYPIMMVLKQVGYQPKAIVDLDYIFKKAHSENLIDTVTNQDYINCKTWFIQNQPLLGYNLGTDGFPCKGGSINVATAFERLAQNNQVEIDRLANILLTHNIWVWRNGAIEAHLGIQKNDSDRISFLQTAKTNMNTNHAADSQSLIDLINWI